MPKEQDLISVIIPVYQVESFLDLCIASVAGQTYQKLQILLIDDGSTDKSGEICDVWAKKDGRIEVVHQKNQGLSGARNTGIQKARGEFLAFVDSDDWIDPGMYEKLKNALEKENASLAACGIEEVYPDRKIPITAPYAAGSSALFFKRMYKNGRFLVSAVNKLYRSICWETIRFPKGKICEDAFTACWVADRAERIVQIPDCCYHYRIRTNSIMTAGFRKESMDEEEAWRKNAAYMRRYHPELAKYAYDFYLQKVDQLRCRIRPEQHQRFAEEYAYLSRILDENTTYILFASSLPLKYRISFIRRNRRKKK